jgi:hypothetical protein
MKKLLFGLYLLFTSIVNGQTLIAFDNIETWNWLGGWWIPSPTSGYYTNAFVSSNSSAAIYGLGSGTSGIEQDWYSLPNVTVSPVHSHTFRFRLGSYRITSTGAGSGVDATDYVTVQLSTNGGVSYVNEMRITGFANAYWNYNGAIALKTANGTLTTYTPTAGGNRTTTGDGYSIIELTVPAGTSNIAVDLYCRVNAAGEEWWIDDISLIRNIALPIELTEFTGYKTNEYNVLKWQTESEYNNSHFILERSTTGEFTENDVVTIVAGAGNSTQLINYNFIDKNAPREINYYMLTQVDYDGNFKQYGPIAIDNRNNKVVIKYINLLGQDVNNSTPGIIFEVYEDGTLKKVWNP